jgi:probable F420-dependent oxidoreductase
MALVLTHPFRFIAPMPTLDKSPGEWRDAVRRIEADGYSTVAVSDHVSRGWAMEPLVAMLAAADATATLRVLSMVLANDYRHPALVHRAIATIDMLSGGRVELGIGAGWLADDYAALGIPLEPPATRIQRLDEAVRLIKELFSATSPVSAAGAHYRTAGLEALPRPVQRPRPPILVGGGGRAVLSLAGREADIAGVNAALVAGSGRREGVAGLTAAAAAEKVGWVGVAARAAGRNAGEPELQVSVLHAHVVDSSSAARATLGRLADEVGLPAAQVEASPAVLIGSVERCCEVLIERRERFGFSYVKLGPDATAAAPIVARLAGT